MKLLFVFPILLSLLIPYQGANTNGEISPLTVVNYKWSKARRTVEARPTPNITPAPQAMIPQNRNFARNARINDSQGARDPNLDTLDGRSAALEKSVQESRTKPKATDGFSYHIKVQNPGKYAVEIVFWEYQFQDPAEPSLLARRQFLCGVSIGGDKSKELEGFSLSGPSDVVNVNTLANKTANPFKEQVLINRVEYADGSIWQRKGWSLAEVKASYDRVLREPWAPGMCKGL